MQRYMLVNIHMNSKCVASNLNKIINHRVHFIFGYSACWPFHPHCWHSKYDFHIKLNHSNYTEIALKLFLNDFILIPEFINWTYLHDCVWFLIPHFICHVFFSFASVLFVFEIWLMFMHSKIQLIEEYCFIANITSVSTVNENWLIYCGYESQKFTYHNMHLFNWQRFVGLLFLSMLQFSCSHLDPNCKKTGVVKFEIWNLKHCCIAIQFCGFAWLCWWVRMDSVEPKY